MTRFERRRIEFWSTLFLIAAAIVSIVAVGAEALSQVLNRSQAFWPDVIKTLIGSFVGAGLAFYSNATYQRFLENRKNKSAGNLALVTLRDQLDDFINLKRDFVATKTAILAENPPAPVWLQSKPGLFYFNERFTFNFESLSFLLEYGSADVLLRLKIAEQRYFNLGQVFEKHAEVTVEMQKKLAEKGHQPGQDFIVEEVAAQLGPELVAKVTSLVTALQRRFDEDLTDYERAIGDLHATLVDIFGKKGVVEVALKQ